MSAFLLSFDFESFEMLFDFKFNSAESAVLCTTLLLSDSADFVPLDTVEGPADLAFMTANGISSSS